MKLIENASVVGVGLGNKTIIVIHIFKSVYEAIISQYNRGSFCVNA